jgi:O-antigen ligase
VTSSAALPARPLQALLVSCCLLLGLAAGVDPKLAVVGALSMAFVLLMVSDLAVGVAVFAAVASVDHLPFSGAALSFAKVLGLVLLISWLAALATQRSAGADFLSTHPVASYGLVLFVAWTAISTTWAENSSAAFEATQRYGLNLVLILIVFTALRESKHVVWMLAGYLIGAAGSAAYGILNPVSGVDANRLAGEGLNANELASALVVAIVIAGAFAVGWRGKPLVRALAVALMAFATLSIFLSLSRSGLVALAVALIASVGFGARWRAPAAVGLVLLSVACVGYFAFVAPPEAVRRVTTAGSGTGRTDIWAVGWRMVKAEPAHGIGAGNFPISSVHYLFQPGLIRRSDFIVDTPKVAHNVYLEVLAELGIVGLVLFLSILAFCIGHMLRAARAFSRLDDRRMELISRAVIVATLATLAADFFASEQFSKQLWLLLALGPAMAAIARRAEQHHAPTTA